MTADYAIRHVTRFAYDAPVRESVMELRMRPAADGAQRVLQFDLQLQPRARVFAYRDHVGNWVHHFDLPRPHTQLVITSHAQVQVDPPPPRPAALDRSAWDTIDGWRDRGEHWDFRQPSAFAAWTDALAALAGSMGEASTRAQDPLTTVRETIAFIHRTFEYTPNSTRVDSPIDEALAARRGVCQDFTHIMLALLRRHGLPCRYVSGYIAPAAAGEAPVTGAIATHAWVEVLLPGIGWLGVDPTNNLDAGIRHVRVAVGRDYGDVPPTKGTFTGEARSELRVAVSFVDPGDLPAIEPAPIVMPMPESRPAAAPGAQMQQQQ